MQTHQIIPAEAGTRHGPPILARRKDTDALRFRDGRHTGPIDGLAARVRGLERGPPRQGRGSGPTGILAGRPAAGGRNERWRHQALHAQGVGESRPLAGHSGAKVLSLTFSRDGRLVAAGREDKSVSVWEAATGEAVADSAITTVRSCLSTSVSTDGPWSAVSGRAYSGRGGPLQAARGGSYPGWSTRSRGPACRPTASCWRRGRAISPSRSGTSLRAGR